ncbi:hypothetical protein BPT24_190 [Tenacibaculum phage pT24]|uniref:Uncharacterized protein n=1 Tax=Tenacibaculum phage pT24 TaxID=1880590 RepID=A0A1B4XWY3_9CAUD|nr:hypothetical protein HYP10_gp190 [Tenacibaculum phage pT24]BAV39315.1 hypothetical protein BPT24_190 [Tenacibaculum phage pT24]
MNKNKSILESFKTRFKNEIEKLDIKMLNELKEPTYIYTLKDMENRRQKLYCQVDVIENLLNNEVLLDNPNKTIDVLNNDIHHLKIGVKQHILNKSMSVNTFIDMVYRKEFMIQMIKMLS